MGYCRFENTARDLRDCIYAIEDGDVYEFSNYELNGFKDLIEAAQELGRMDHETDKILEYYESADTE